MERPQPSDLQHQWAVVLVGFVGVTFLSVMLMIQVHQRFALALYPSGSGAAKEQRASVERFIRIPPPHGEPSDKLENLSDPDYFNQVRTTARATTLTAPWSALTILYVTAALSAIAVAMFIVVRQLRNTPPCDRLPATFASLWSATALLLVGINLKWGAAETNHSRELIEVFIPSLSSLTLVRLTLDALTPVVIAAAFSVLLLPVSSTASTTDKTIQELAHRLRTARQLLTVSSLVLALAIALTYTYFRIPAVVMGNDAGGSWSPDADLLTFALGLVTVHGAMYSSALFVVYGSVTWILNGQISKLWAGADKSFPDLAIWRQGQQIDATLSSQFGTLAKIIAPLFAALLSGGVAESLLAAIGG